MSPRNWRTGAHPAPQLAAPTDSPDTLIGDEVVNETRFVKRPKPSYLSPTPAQAKAHREAMKKAYPSGWSPPRKLSRQAMEALRALHATDPEAFTTPMLASQFRISPEAVRRILKSKWEPTKEERTRMAERERRHREDWVKQKRVEETKRLRVLLATMERRKSKERKDSGLKLK